MKHNVSCDLREDVSILVGISHSAQADHVSDRDTSEEDLLIIEDEYHQAVNLVHALLCWQTWQVRIIASAAYQKLLPVSGRSH